MAETIAKSKLREAELDIEVEAKAQRQMPQVGARNAIKKETGRKCKDNFAWILSCFFHFFVMNR